MAESAATLVEFMDENEEGLWHRVPLSDLEFDAAREAQILAGLREFGFFMETGFSCPDFFIRAARYACGVAQWARDGELIAEQRRAQIEREAAELCVPGFLTPTWRRMYGAESGQ